MALTVLARPESSVLLVIDIQERLARAMRPADRDRVLRNGRKLIQAANLLGVPVFVTEQYPKGLGRTEECLRQLLPSSASWWEKTSFSCCRVPGLMAEIDRLDRRQVVLAGMEAHVCVLQTAIELLQAGQIVFVAEDATCSRDPARQRTAMARLRAAGAIVTCTESVIFEWLGDAAHPRFKEVAALLR